MVAMQMMMFTMSMRAMMMLVMMDGMMPIATWKMMAVTIRSVRRYLFR